MSDSSVQDPTSGRPEKDSVVEIVSPFPVRLEEEVTKGFGRGSKQLGIPTANYPQEYVDSSDVSTLSPGIYYGYSYVSPPDSDEPTQSGEGIILPMVMSLGYNPYYKNEKKSAEVHVIHNFERDFYGQTMKTLVLGFIRSERSYDSLDALIKDIKFDIEFAKNTLKLDVYSQKNFESILL